MAKRMMLNVKLESMGLPEGFGEKLTLCIAYSESGGIKYAAKSLHLNICSASGMYQFNLIKR